MEYGYGYLRPQKLSGLDNVEDLETLRPYLCPKSGGDPGRCKNCPGLRSCQTGQKAAVILDRAVEKTGKWEKAWAAGQKSETPAQKAPEPINTTKDRETFQAACESGNARMWLIRAGYSEASAQEKLIFWVSHYPDITKEFGRKRILQKQRSVTVSSLGHADEKAKIEASPQETAERQEPEPELTERAPEEKKGAWTQERRARYAMLREQGGRENCRAALASGDPIRYLIEHGKTSATARQTVNRWKKKYPDLFKEEVVPKEEESRAADQEDEISLTDFLASFGIPTFTKTPVEPVVQAADTTQAESDQMVQLAELMEQEAGIMKQIADLHGQLRAIREQRQQLEQDIKY